MLPSTGLGHALGLIFGVVCPLSLSLYFGNGHYSVVSVVRVQGARNSADRQELKKQEEMPVTTNQAYARTCFLPGKQGHGRI
jgi:hypothetical protein